MVRGISVVSVGLRFIEYRIFHWPVHLKIATSKPVDTNKQIPKSADWDTVSAWRKNRRQHLLTKRISLSHRHKNRVRDQIVEILRQQIAPPDGARIGFYWPMNGEIDLRRLIRDLVSKGAQAALPVIISKTQPMEFWEWDPKKKLYNRGLWGIPAPAERKHVRLTVMLVPLLGFDAHGHRLGHGGGYYDRTLATIQPKTLTIGVGYDFGRLATIHPQPCDVPLDAIVTEIGITRFNGNG
ncbi:MAG TPA: 5-formyltetrahydrofolate cyclo-ligase [Woeseiaceae bacterium]|nr:5-formyltetrahydrofolate cyclo-ligase [Woeseiaceae bacterium]